MRLDELQGEDTIPGLELRPSVVQLIASRYIDFATAVL
jgi:hypothetical protein